MQVVQVLRMILPKFYNEHVHPNSRQQTVSFQYSRAVLPNIHTAVTQQHFSFSIQSATISKVCA